MAASGGGGGSTGADADAVLSGIGVGEPGVGLAGGGRAVSAARPVDSETNFLGAFDFLFFGITVVLEVIRGKRKERTGEGFKLDRIIFITHYLTTNK